MDRRLDAFGKLVMVKMRDRALDDFEMMAVGHWKAPSRRKLQGALAKLDAKQKDVVRRTVRAAVDTAIHDFLFALQEAGDAKEIAVVIGGKDIASLSDGLQGEPFGEDGWQARFSAFGQAPEED